MNEIYHLEYTNHWKHFLGNTLEDPMRTWWALDPGTRYCNIIEKRSIPYRINFSSSYKGEIDYIVNGKIYDKARVSIRLVVPKYEGGNWNYTEEEFQVQVAGSLFIPHTYMGEALSPDLFSIMSLLHPEAKHGFYNHDTHQWELVVESKNKELQTTFPDTYLEDRMGFSYFQWDGNIYRCRADNWGPIDVSTNMPANARWESPAWLFKTLQPVQ